MHFWARGYFVTMVGADENVVRAYIQQQKLEDKRLDQLTILTKIDHHLVVREFLEYTALSVSRF